jgi:hypothetical protein
VLQQALLVEVPSGSFSRVQVGLEGQAGQLPKLDMYWIYRWVGGCLCWGGGRGRGMLVFRGV